MLYTSSSPCLYWNTESHACVQFVKLCNPISKLLQNAFSKWTEGELCFHICNETCEARKHVFEPMQYIWIWTETVETWSTSDHCDWVLNYNIVETVHILQCKIVDCCGIADIRANYQISICRCSLLLKIFVAGKWRCIIYSWISYCSFFPQISCPQLWFKNHCHYQFPHWS